jgi:uncharacterized protein
MRKPGSKGEHYLQKKLNTEKRASLFYKTQLLNNLNSEMCEFIAKQEFVFISTADSNGECDASFRSGHAGFVSVLNENMLIFPEYRGNGVLASMGNISENPHIGMIFIDFYESSIGLHVNGKAEILSQEELEAETEYSEKISLALGQCGARKPVSWIRVVVEESYIHCSKHIPLMQKREKTIQLGSDEGKLKSDNFFNTKNRKDSE